MEQVIQILEQIKPEINFQKEEHLIDDELLTSFDIITLVALLNQKFQVSITAKEVVPENFQSAKCIYQMIERIK